MEDHYIIWIVSASLNSHSDKHRTETVTENSSCSSNNNETEYWIHVARTAVGVFIASSLCCIISFSDYFWSAWDKFSVVPVMHMDSTYRLSSHVDICWKE